ncbi:hypothetical protein T484DRAFT_1756765 [Baffinella frigidus]|nr:hypothetical protein T484DRAFT_1756765 [Cryptophyta sp. CCMP2293]
MLYVDNWVASEYLVNTNSCAAMLAASLLVHELRDAGVQERVHGEFAHTVALSMLVAVNLLVIVLGENHTLGNVLSHFPPSTSPYSTADVSKRPRQSHLSLHSSHHNSSTYTASSLLCVLCNCILLVVLSTCSMPVNTHDPLLNNLRVWSFMVLSLVWLYTVYYRELRYSTVAPFTPCVLRFSSILFLTPTPFAVGGIAMIAGVLAVVYFRLEMHYQENSLVPTSTPDYVYQPIHTPDKAVVVGRDAPTGSGISYRAPVVLHEKADSLALTISNGSGSIASGTGGVSGFGLLPGGADSAGLDTPPLLPTQQPSIDYNSLFQEVMDEQAA